MSARDLWVFGYGSLIWRPGFAHRGAYQAKLFGFHRSLCVYSHVHRGTPESPGLVMGLDRGGSCHGMAYHVDEAHRDEVMRYLREREQATMVYRERDQKVHLMDRGDGMPRTVWAVTYCVDRAHQQYAGALPREEQLSIVRGAKGQSGFNPDYVIETERALQRMGVHDATLRWLSTRLQSAGV
ncbi:MAG: gamma-glutamylcyclotransferase [Pseudomonadota bacterium]